MQILSKLAIISVSPEDHQVSFIPPAEIVAAARAQKAPVIAFTYNEPTVFTEYLTDISRDAKKLGIRCVLISCGFMNEAPLTEMCNVLGAIKIDLKGYSENFYRTCVRGKAASRPRSINQISKSGVHLEIVNLVVPTLNDSDKMMQGLIDWIWEKSGPMFLSISPVFILTIRFLIFRLRRLPPLNAPITWP